MWVCYLIVVVEQGKELPHVIEVIPGDLGETKLVEVTKGDGWECEVSSGHLVQLGDVRVFQVV